VWLRYELVHPTQGNETLLSPTKDELGDQEMFETML
jgi:hypothetical protein